MTRWVTMLASFQLGVTASDHLWIAGAMIVVLTAIQCALAAVDAARRVAHASAQRSREACLLEARLATARKRRDAEQQ